MMTRDGELACKKQLEALGFCDGCPLLHNESGSCDSFGVQLDPDTEDCPVDFDYADMDCERYDDWVEYARSFLMEHPEYNEE